MSHSSKPAPIEGQAAKAVDPVTSCSALVATEKNYKSIQRKMLGERVRRTQPGFPPQDGRCDKIKKSFVFIPDGPFGFRNRTPLVSAFGDTFEIITPVYCGCSFAQQAVGDGCSVCNPELAADCA